MEKIFQILAVFVLMMLLITRFIRGREPRYAWYFYSSGEALGVGEESVPSRF